MGRFELGSSLVLVFTAPKDFQFVVQPGQKLNYGQPLGVITDGDKWMENVARWTNIGIKLNGETNWKATMSLPGVAMADKIEMFGSEIQPGKCARWKWCWLWTVLKDRLLLWRYSYPHNVKITKEIDADCWLVKF